MQFAHVDPRGMLCRGTNAVLFCQQHGLAELQAVFKPGNASAIVVLKVCYQVTARTCADLWRQAQTAESHFSVSLIFMLI